MATVFNLCSRLIIIEKMKKNDCSSVIEKMDVYLANDRLTTDEYNELINQIKNN